MRAWKGTHRRTVEHRRSRTARRLHPQARARQHLPFQGQGRGAQAIYLHASQATAQLCRRSQKFRQILRTNYGCGQKGSIIKEPNAVMILIQVWMQRKTAFLCGAPLSLETESLSWQRIATFCRIQDWTEPTKYTWRLIHAYNLLFPWCYFIKIC